MERERVGAAGRLSSKGNVATTLCMVHLHRARRGSGRASSAFKNSPSLSRRAERSDPVCARAQKMCLSKKIPRNPFLAAANRERSFSPGPTLSRFTKDREGPLKDYVFFHATSKASL